MCLDNEIERIHAQKLMRKFTTELPGKMPTSLVHPLVAIGQDGASERDRMVRASLACICELSKNISYTRADLLSQFTHYSIYLYPYIIWVNSVDPDRLAHTCHLIRIYTVRF
jgi:hypothetical protein